MDQPLQYPKKKPEQLSEDLDKSGFHWLSELPVIIPVAILMVVYALIYYINANYTWEQAQSLLGQLEITQDIIGFIAIGFAAQMVDGAMGMAYGITCNSLLMSYGVPPAVSSAGIHVAEVFTTGISGLSHLKLGNVNKKLFRNLVIPGAIGAIIGAYIITNIDGNDGKLIKPYISCYILLMGLLVISKAFKKQGKKEKTKNLNILALFGGFVDAVGGGGWGPVVTSTLIGRGRNPRYTIGSVNLAEFFVAFAGAGMFVLMIGLNNYQVILGLILGGMVAAPIAAFLTNKINPRYLMVIVGTLICFLSIRTIWNAWF